jgi:hypothetical protein
MNELPALPQLSPQRHKGEQKNLPAGGPLKQGPWMNGLSPSSALPRIHLWSACRHDNRSRSEVAEGIPVCGACGGALLSLLSLLVLRTFLADDSTPVGCEAVSLG